MAGLRGLRSAAVAATTVAVVVLPAGCGIPTTKVPVDAGAAPSRVSCLAPGSEASPTTPDQAPASPRAGHATVFLVCGSALVAVGRSDDSLGASASSRQDTARALLAQLRHRPSTAETRAGFSSTVPESLVAQESLPGDPPRSTRLSVQPDDLPAFALAQIVCTFSQAAVTGSDGSVWLGGPAGRRGTTPHRYACSPDVLAHPDIAQNRGWGSPTAAPSPATTP
ncbi:hypothetical protein ACFV3R_08285 [Streptomyces sp. NPDC059740]|uniref:hypothetical protein n=1 Tax=Streptomyces sp. NPDC059740 TaxID=3346926 RepID=UPI00364B2882